MSIGQFIYKLRNRWDYYTATEEVQKEIAALNREKLVVKFSGGRYYMPEVALEIPAGAIDNIFGRYDLLVNNMQNLGGQYVWEEDRLMFAFKKLKLQITSCNELFIIDEIFNHHCYNFELSGGQLCNVIDIGMNVGLASLFFASKDFVKEVYAFEPFPQSFNQARTNFSDNSFVSQKIKPFNFGLGKEEKVATGFYNPLASGTSGGFAQNRAKRPLEEPILIKDAFETVSSIIRDSPGLPFVMKVDCEGAEYEIMQSFFEKNIPEAIRAVLMEWHGILPEDFRNKFLETGFTLVTTRERKDLGLMYAFR